MHSVEDAKLVCIGGGHGLGRLLASLKDAGPNLTGIVATTDDGGSTGRLREEAETIAWGDLRNCLTQMCSSQTVGTLLFDYRFQTQGDLNGHNLGNLVLFALEQLSVRPTDAIEVIRDMLRIESHLYPMSDTPTSLMAKTVKTSSGGGNILVGEIVIDDSEEEIDSLYLEPQVNAEIEAIQSIMSADAIVLSAGSFMTSIMPSLLVANIVKSINETSASLILVVNLRQEILGGRALTFAKQLELLQAAGIRKLDYILWPTCREHEMEPSAEMNIIDCDMGPADSALHDSEKLKKQILELI
ncbi:MAG: uridine diphosphate-N-acetylglucosamine-binding protein YvcK [Oleispira sp.]|nr:uridine diphosphate-N-acetylglucosamine-binding protein YvcK [Oleispira sp.]MBL4882483.1 uridine diphosphate-N-acetylglucosamine-binding protein YvcK [Oleispira sp.]